MLDVALKGRSVYEIHRAEEMTYFLKRHSRRFKAVAVCRSLGKTGINLEYYRVIQFLREHPGMLDGWTGGIIVDAGSELLPNLQPGNLPLRLTSPAVLFVGRPLVEGTSSLANFAIVAQNMDTDLMTAYQKSAGLLVREILDF